MSHQCNPEKFQVSRRAMIAGVGALWAASSVEFAQAASSAGQRLSLNGTWKFALAPDEGAALALENFHLPEFKASGFNDTLVPSNWAVLGYEEPVYRGFPDDKASEGFYLHDFTVPADWRGKRILLHFGGVWSSAEVWWNGKRLGRHDSGFTSFSYDITPNVIAGKTNRLAVRVRQVTREYKFDVYDDWTLGGIYRDVSLEAMPGKRWLDRVVVNTEFDDLYRDADLKVRVLVSDLHKSTVPGNYMSPDAEPYELRLTLLNKDGVEVHKYQQKIEGHYASDRETRLSFRLNSPHHWTAETPYLYVLRIDLIEKGQIAHTRTEKVGFRQISTEGGVFRVNGQAVKLRGVNRHDEHPDVGRATRYEHWLEDIALMKAANINFIRLAHYTHARGFIELCDEMGMYVGNEISIGGGSREIFYDSSYMDGALIRSYETVVRDINSPSIIYWSIGNEDPLTTMHMASINTVKGLDPTRPVLIPWRAEDWLPPEIDLISPHYWKPQDYDELASRSTRPVISTEYTHAYANHGMGGLEARWKALTQHPAGAGAAIWLWADQGIKSKTPKRGVGGDDYLRLTEDGWDGIVDAYRKPTRDYWETKAVYAQVYPAVDRLRFIPGQKSIRVPIQNDYDFTDLKTVKINWAIMEEGRELAKGTGTISGQPHAASPFTLPLEALQSVRPGKVYYAWFIFTTADGAEITRRAVELINGGEVLPATRARHPLTLTRGDKVVVQVGDSRFVFDPRTGHMTGAESGGIALINGLTPTIWHDLDDNERFIMGEKLLSTLPDLNVYRPSVKEWDVQQTADSVHIKAHVEYVVDPANRFTASYDYRVSSDGEFNVRYEIRPEVTAPWVPIVGMALTSTPELNHINWLGLGPHDAYPNKKTAPILGVWGGVTGSTDVTGIKATRWVEKAGPNGQGFRVVNDGHMEHDARSPDRLSVLSAVLGRPEKDRKADDSLPQLTTADTPPFIGTFSILLKA